MGKVIAGYALSLDGFIADSQDSVHQLFGWLANGDTELTVMGRVFMTSSASAKHYHNLFAGAGAHVTGRRDFDVSRAWNGKHPLGIPAFIVTHSVPPEWAGEGSPFTFVTDGVESAIQKARNVAGGKNILLGGSTIAQQCLRAGLVDELQIDLVPILLGAGVRLFDHLDNAPIEVESEEVIHAPGVTHLRYRVIR